MVASPTETALRIAHKTATSDGIPVNGGLLHTEGGGRTDNIPADVLDGSYVIPADVVSGLGQGNTMAGAKVLDAIFGGRGAIPKEENSDAAPAKLREMARKFGGKTDSDAGTGKRVPIMAAGGEYVVPPHVVSGIGNGDMKKGHSVLDHFVTERRKHTIRTMAKLPGPKKS